MVRIVDAVGHRSSAVRRNVATCVFVVGAFVIAALLGCGRAPEAAPVERNGDAASATSVIPDAERNQAVTEETPEATDVTPDATEETPLAEDLTVVGDVSDSRGFTRTDELLAAITIFTLAIFVGFELITKVPPTLHTPLMSGSNAISGITLVGAILMAGSNSWWAALCGMIAVTLASINVVGGFLVTDRMLSMFQKR